MTKFFRISCTTFLTILISMTAVCQQVKQVKLTDFELQASAVVHSSGEEISSPEYKPAVYWFPVRVPSTVLTGLVANGIYPDPYQGLNNMLIPDASDELNAQYGLEKYSHLPNDPNPWKKPYWYRSSFKVPAEDKGRTFHLIFKGINYRAAVWVNGRQFTDSTQMAGMFGQYAINVSKAIRPGEENAVAVKIYPLDFPGLPDKEQLEAFGDFFLNGGPTGDIGKNVTMLCSVGWDWIPPVRDRNMGIWLPVYLRTTGGLTISDPQLITELPGLPDTTKASVSLKLRINNQMEKSAKAKLDISIAPENFKGSAIRFSRDISVQGASTEIDLNTENTKELAINDPAIWWPNGYGKPNLYRIRMQLSDRGQTLDDTSFVFGIRTVSTKSVDVKGTWRRDFYINGRRIHITGGAWVPDMMLNRDSLRYDYEMRLCRNSNINLVRIWGGGVTPCDEFFEAADRYGLLVWSDFWITGDTQGEFKGSPDWPFDGKIFINNVRSTILRIRNHPSLMVWTGGNEGHARKELYDVMRNSIITLDGTRPYIPSSSGFAKLPAGFDGSWPDNLPSGVYSGGPYTWQDPKVYYSKAIAGRDWVFKDETGIPSMVPYNILHRIIPNLVWDTTRPYPLNNTWGYHDAATGNGKWDRYYNEMVKRYGKPVSMEDFCNKMQLMNAMGYQGIFEAAGHKLNDIGGVMLWKLNAAFPSVVWQVYDWYLMPNAGYYFMQNACEPLHIQLNPVDSKVIALNRTAKLTRELTANIDVYDINSASKFHKEKKLSLASTEVKEILTLPASIKDPGVSFVILSLKDEMGKTVSQNTYWLSPTNEFSTMSAMKNTGIEAVLEEKVNEDKNMKSWTLTLTNTSQILAFFIRPQLMGNNEEILPSLWTAGYFTLAPSESRTITVSCPVQKITGKKLVIKISGWNVNEKELLIN